MRRPVDSRALRRGGLARFWRGGGCDLAHDAACAFSPPGARVFVDTMAACPVEPGDLVTPIQQGELEAAHLLGEVGAVLGGGLAGRGADDEVTLFKSVGLSLIHI